MIGILNAIISGLGTVLTGLFSLLPPSPFQFTYSLNNTWLGYINYFLPFSSAIAHLSLYLVAVGVYYGFRAVLRWIKAIN